MKTIKSFTCFCLAKGIISTSAHAAYPLVVDDAEVLGPGESELVLWVEFERDSDSRAYALPVEFSHGIAERIEVAIVTGFQHARTNDPRQRSEGWLDTKVALKWQALEADRIPYSLTFETGLSLPTASVSRELGSGTYDVGFNLAATRHWDAFAVDINIGYLFNDHFRGKRSDGDEWFTGIAIRHEVTSATLLFLEGYMDIPVGTRSGTITTVRTGLMTEVAEGMSLGLAIGTAFGTDSPDLLGTAGFLWEF